MDTQHHTVDFETPLTVKYIYAEADPNNPQQSVSRFAHVFPITTIQTRSDVLAKALTALDTVVFMEVSRGEELPPARYIALRRKNADQAEYIYKLERGEPYVVDAFTYRTHAIPLELSPKTLANPFWLVQLWNSLMERHVRRAMRRMIPVNTEIAKDAHATVVYTYEPTEKLLPAPKAQPTSGSPLPEEVIQAVRYDTQAAPEKPSERYIPIEDTPMPDPLAYESEEEQDLKVPIDEITFEEDDPFNV